MPGVETKGEPRRRGGISGVWRSLSTLVNGDRADSRLQYLVFGLVVLICIVLGVVIDVLAG